MENPSLNILHVMCIFCTSALTLELFTIKLPSFASFNSIDFNFNLISATENVKHKEKSNQL